MNYLIRGVINQLSSLYDRIPSNVKPRNKTMNQDFVSYSLLCMIAYASLILILTRFVLS